MQVLRTSDHESLQREILRILVDFPLLLGHTFAEHWNVIESPEIDYPDC